MAITNGTNLNAVPAPAKQTLQSNYIDLTSSATAGWAQQYLPDLMEEESEVFGNRSVSGFLEMVGAEEAMTSDQVVWSEQGRLHLSYTGTTHASTNGIILLQKDADGNDIDAAGEDNHGVRVGDTVLVTSASATVRCYVSAVDNTLPDVSITVKPYTAATLNAVSGISTGTAVSVFVYGSEFKKGSNGRSGANTPGFKTFTNNPIIMKDKYEVSGSDASQIGWVEVSGEEGQNGYLWYLKAAGDTRARFTDYCEMALIEAEKAATGSGAIGEGLAGTEGLFAALEFLKDLGYVGGMKRLEKPVYPIEVGRGYELPYSFDVFASGPVHKWHP